MGARNSLMQRSSGTESSGRIAVVVSQMKGQCVFEVGVQAGVIQLALRGASHLLNKMRTNVLRLDGITW